MNRILQLFTVFISLTVLFSCDKTSEREAKIEAIPMEFDIVRFDQIFAEATPSDLPRLKENYPIFFPRQFHDSIWIGKMQDTLQQQLDAEVDKAFPNNSVLEDELRPLFQHIQYYFPEFEAPTVVTVTSDVDYQNKAIATDSLMVLSLDTYLGAEHPFYEGIQKYISKNLKPSQIAPDVAEAYAKQLTAYPRKRHFLGQMIYYGRILYLKNLWVPNAEDSTIIGHSPEEWQWAEENEQQIWRYFVENELLYSSEPKLGARFLNPAPFSKFYLEIDNESPGEIGRYIGWKIVEAYMRNNDISIKQMLQKPAEEIFNNSKYKPAK